MVYQVIVFELLVLTLLMFQVFGIIDLSKTNFLNFSGFEKVKQNQKHLQIIQYLLIL